MRKTGERQSTRGAAISDAGGDWLRTPCGRSSEESRASEAGLLERIRSIRRSAGLVYEHGGRRFWAPRSVEELARLVAAAPETNVSLLCVAGDETYRETLANAGFKRIITKPIAGAALVEMLYPADGAEESGGSAPDLVSRAA